MLGQDVWRKVGTRFIKQIKGEEMKVRQERSVGHKRPRCCQVVLAKDLNKMINRKCSLRSIPDRAAGKWRDCQEILAFNVASSSLVNIESGADFDPATRALGRAFGYTFKASRGKTVCEPKYNAGCVEGPAAAWPCECDDTAAACSARCSASVANLASVLAASAMAESVLASPSQ